MSILTQTNSNIYDASISGKNISDEFEEKLNNELKESIGREFLKSLKINRGKYTMSSA